jgi:hypothetical protein
MGYLSLYGGEFSGPISMLTAGTIPAFFLIAWMLLLLVHAGVICLVFITGKKYFKPLLVALPILFILLNILVGSIFIIIFLLPFIVMWSLCLMKFGEEKRKQQGIK